MTNDSLVSMGPLKTSTKVFEPHIPTLVSLVGEDERW
jgi:hypothetical protein